MLMSNEKAERKNRKVTTSATSAAMGIYCAKNKEALNGKSLQQVAAILRKEFNGQVVSDGAVISACEAAGVVVTRREYNKGKASNSRRLAGVIARLVDAIEKSIGAQPDTLLSAEDRELIAKIRGGHQE